MDKNKHTLGIATKLLLFTLSIILTLSVQFNTPLTVHAEYEDIVNAAVNSMGGGGTKKDGTVPNGVSQKRTGYLCYLLNDDETGTVAKDAAGATYPAYFFTSPDYSQLSGTKYIMKSRRGHSVSSSKAPAPWNCQPWDNNNDNITSNESTIKTWFQSKEKGVENSQKFVQTNWGEAAAKQFEQGKYVIVIETVMHFQYAVPNDQKITASDLTLEVKNTIKQGAKNSAGMQLYKYSPPDKTIRKMASDRKVITAGRDISDVKADLYDVLVQEIIDDVTARVVAKLNESQDKWKNIDVPIVGAIPNLIQYRNQLDGPTVFDSYILNVAPKAEQLEHDQAGFTKYTGGFPMSVDNALNTGVAMMIVSYSDPKTGQTTCDEPKIPAPHDPPNESQDGAFKIVKCYRTKKADGTFKESESSTKIKDDSSPNISVEDEWEKRGDYKLKQFLISEKYVPTLKSTDWEKAFYYEKTISFTRGVIEENIKAKMDIELKAPETTVYLLLEKEEGGDGDDDQTTCDEPKIPAPHDPPDESTGKTTIIKNYRTKNTITNVKTDDGKTHRDNVSNKITIEDEDPAYKVIGWATSNQKNYNIDSRTWETSVPGIKTQHGTSAGSVTLNSPNETVLYVLLEKRELGTPTDVWPDPNYKISQSTITRKVKISSPDRLLP